MNPAGLYELIEKLWQHNQWVGFLVGLVVGGAGGASLFRLWWPAHLKVKCENLQEEGVALRSENDHLGERLGEVEKHCTALQQLNGNLEARLGLKEKEFDRLSDGRDRLQGELAVSLERAARVEDQLGETERRRGELESKFTTWLNRGVRKRWDQPVAAGAPAFRPLHARGMPIVSVVNLKGGVGKTTITANLGVALAQRGLRVLLADLDYQGSLSSLCLAPQEAQDARQGRRFVQEVLRNGKADRATEVFRNAIRLEDLGAGPAYLLATDQDGLDEIESQAMAHWLMGVSGDDVRFRLRAALHDPAISQEYDIILLDCPPRLSTACVNALAASDFALIPVMLESTSAEATPRLLRWLRNFQGTLCPELAVLGVVANRVHLYQEKPVQRQRVLWDNLKDQSRAAWGRDVRFFDEAMIRQFANLPHRLAALCPAGKATMNDLADVVWKELPPYARRRASAVPPVAGSPAPGVRS